MKYLFLLLSIFPIVSGAQSLFTEDKLWSIMIGPGGDCGQFYCWSYYTKTDGDTIIDEQSYKIVMNSSDSLLNDWSIVGFAREVGHQVFYRKNNADTECLLYDFGCSLGDTLTLNCWCPEEFKFKVDSIKYVHVLGENRKHIYLTCLLNDTVHLPGEFWIEGIGSIGGILNGGGSNNCMVGGSENLLCCYKNEVEIYHDPEYNDCFLGKKMVNSAHHSYLNDKALKIYPNPAMHKFTISNPTNIQFEGIELIDLSGRSIQKWQNFNPGENMFKIENILSGIYLLRMETENGNRTVKLVVQ